MPEIPDIVNYCEALEERLKGSCLQKISLRNPFLLRTVEPPVDALIDRKLIGVERLGKRVVLAFADEYFLVIHLMIAGRFRWIAEVPGAKAAKAPSGKQLLLVLTFPVGCLYLTEAGSKRRASVHVVKGQSNLDAMDPGGLEVQGSSLDVFKARVRASNHTLKRILTDPRILSGIGNAYSDEILHRAGLSPMLQSQKVDDQTLATLYESIRDVLEEWTDRLREERHSGDGFPKKVTAFHKAMAAHGKHGQPCPVCGSPIQRIVYSTNETNYCARCQNGGAVLKDRALSRLLKDSWPKRLDD